MCTSSVSNVIYHKFSHGAAFYTLNGKNVNAMLEYNTKTVLFKLDDVSNVLWRKSRTSFSQSNDVIKANVSI